MKFFHGILGFCTWGSLVVTASAFVPSWKKCEIHLIQGRSYPTSPELSKRRNLLSFSSSSSFSGKQHLRLFYQDESAGNTDPQSRPEQFRPNPSFERDETMRKVEDATNSFLRASRSSFKHFEGMTNRLLNRQPLLALGMFVGLGFLVAYMLGFFFLGGYIETWNPVENDSIPYWDDEVLIITRKP